MEINSKLLKQGEAHFIIDPSLCGGKVVDIFASEKLAAGLSDKTIQQAINTATTEGVVKINLNADAHEGYGCPIGSVVATEKTIMLGPVGYDISCSVSYIQTNIPPEWLKDKADRRKLINKICEYVPYGTGTTRAPKQIKIARQTYMDILNYGASDDALLHKLGISIDWLEHLERRSLPADASLLSKDVLRRGDGQLGSIGSGNHFLEAQRVKILDKDIARKWNIEEGTAFLTHCGSRGLGHQIATEYFAKLWDHFNLNNIPLNDRELVYAYLGSKTGQDYIKSMGCASNFAIINHLILNTAIKSALKELYPQAKCQFVYMISHNLAQEETIDGKKLLIHRKGATRAFPACHPMLKGTKFFETGHPVIIPGSSVSGSSIMVGLESGKKNLYTVPHGAGRSMGRNEAKRQFTQEYVDTKMAEADVLFNKRYYPVDEYTEAYKDYSEVISSVKNAGLAREVASMSPMFVIKGD